MSLRNHVKIDNGVLAHLGVCHTNRTGQTSEEGGLELILATLLSLSIRCLHFCGVSHSRLMDPVWTDQYLNIPRTCPVLLQDMAVEWGMLLDFYDEFYRPINHVSEIFHRVPVLQKTCQSSKLQCLSGSVQISTPVDHPTTSLVSIDRAQLVLRARF